MSDTSWLIRPPSAAQNGQSAVRSGQMHAKDSGNFAKLMASQNMGMALANQGAAPSLSGNGLVLAGRSPSDLMRMQLFNKAQNDLSQTQALSGMMQAMHTQGSTLDLARSMGAARHLRAISHGDALFGPGIASAPGDFVNACPSRRKTQQAKKAKRSQTFESEGLGVLSAQFESGKDGIAAIGYDGTGGTSYGKYQIASKVGTMKDFLAFCDTEAPDIASRLRHSGPANTGSRRGAMPNTWKAIAEEQPERFEALQEAFAKKSHYEPALASIVQRTGLSEETLSPAMREVIWSTAIQHGPAGASKIFARADGMSGSPNDPNYERNMINNVYKIRAGQFGSSTEAVRAAVQNRFKKEKLLALNMLGSTRSDTIA
ncbi:MAG: hypothetical protein J5803_05400 [Desulfovibrio sp.]|nr:hypothetical protein [Desulfovibrio sp.]